MTVVETVIVAPFLNLGCGAYPIEGYTNVDLESEEADVTGDFTEMTFEGVEKVEMSHILEHLSWQRTIPTLQRIRSWMTPGATIRIEVPDMERIMARGVFDPASLVAIYGIQSSEGEFHKAGFTRAMLEDALYVAGFHVVSSRTFLSDHEQRKGFPCLSVLAQTR